MNLEAKLLIAFDKQKVDRTLGLRDMGQCLCSKHNKLHVSVSECGTSYVNNKLPSKEVLSEALQYLTKELERQKCLLESVEESDIDLPGFSCKELKDHVSEMALLVSSIKKRLQYDYRKVVCRCKFMRKTNPCTHV